MGGRNVGGVLSSEFTHAQQIHIRAHMHTAGVCHQWSDQGDRKQTANITSWKHNRVLVVHGSSLYNHSTWRLLNYYYVRIIIPLRVCKCA